MVISSIYWTECFNQWCYCFSVFNTICKHHWSTLSANHVTAFLCSAPSANIHLLILSANDVTAFLSSTPSASTHQSTLSANDVTAFLWSTPPASTHQSTLSANDVTAFLCSTSSASTHWSTHSVNHVTAFLCSTPSTSTHWSTLSNKGVFQHFNFSYQEIKISNKAQVINISQRNRSSAAMSQSNHWSIPTIANEISCCHFQLVSPHHWHRDLC